MECMHALYYLEKVLVFVCMSQLGSIVFVRVCEPLCKLLVWLMECNVPGFCTRSAGGWACLHSGSNGPLQWWRRWAPFPSAAWWRSTAWTEAPQHTPVNTNTHTHTDKATDSHMREHHNIKKRKKEKKHTRLQHLLCTHTFNLETLLIRYKEESYMCMCKHLHTLHVLFGALTLRNLWRRKANQFVSIFSATDSVLKWPKKI